jgi:hypothetical protein
VTAYSSLFLLFFSGLQAIIFIPSHSTPVFLPPSDPPAILTTELSGLVDNGFLFREGLSLLLPASRLSCLPSFGVSGGFLYFRVPKHQFQVRSLRSCVFFFSEGERCICVASWDADLMSSNLAGTGTGRTPFRKGQEDVLYLSSSRLSTAAFLHEDPRYPRTLPSISRKNFRYVSRTRYGGPCRCRNFSAARSQ